MIDTEDVETVTPMNMSLQIVLIINATDAKD
jgi:hypothetical protein